MLRVQALTRFQRGRVLHARNPQLPAPGAFQLVHEDRLHGLCPAFLPVLATAPGGRADAQEVGRAQAGSVISLVGETLHQIRAKAVALLEVAWQAAQDAPEHVAGQVRAAHRRADQETAQAHDALKMAPAPGVVPSDPAVARRGPQCGGGKSRRSEPTVRRTNEVAHLAAREGRHPVRVLTCDQRVPQSPVRRVRDGDDPEIPYPRGMRWHSFGLGDIGLEQARPALHRGGLRRRKDDVGNSFGQGGERLHAPGKLRAPARVGERKLLADPPPQGGAAVEPLPRQDRRDTRNRRLVAQCAADPGL